MKTELLCKICNLRYDNEYTSFPSLDHCPLCDAKIKDPRCELKWVFQSVFEKTTPDNMKIITFEGINKVRKDLDFVISELRNIEKDLLLKQLIYVKLIDETNKMLQLN